MEYFGNTRICHFTLLYSHILGCLSGRASKTQMGEGDLQYHRENMTTAGRYFTDISRSASKSPIQDQESMLFLWVSVSMGDLGPMSTVCYPSIYDFSLLIQSKIFLVFSAEEEK